MEEIGREWRGHKTNYTHEEREEKNRKRREYLRKISTPELKEKNKLKMREYRQKLTPEQKESRNKKNQEYRKKLTPEQKEKINMKKREVRKNLTREQKDERNKKNCEYRKNETLEYKEKHKQNLRERYKILTSDQRVWMRQMWREKYRKYRTTNKKRENKVSDYLEDTTKEQNLKYFGENLNTSGELDISTEEFNIGMKQRDFCYTCRMQFLNRSALLEHVIMHVTLPSIILSRINERKKTLDCIKQESKTIQLDIGLYSNISQSAIHIKTEHVEDIKYEFNDTHVDIKTEIEIDIASFYTHIKNEIEYT